MNVEHIRVQGDGVELHVAHAGEGPPVILLHGFPENWKSWHHQIMALSEVGFSVWAPDLRGYNRSEKPAGREAYHLRHLIEDVAAIVRATGQARTHIVGHDWGGIIAWTFAGRFPELVDKLVILNAPHMQLYMERVFHFPQILRSWYVLFFQLPHLPELLISAGNFLIIRTMFRYGPARRAAFSNPAIDEYVEALSKPGALTAALNYYRENLGSDAMTLARSARTEAETLVIWGERDLALGIELLEGLDAMAPHVQTHRIPDAGHWVQNEAPEEVNQVLLAFLRLSEMEFGTSHKPL
jgi:pimeloyl-ACP methyl ester carboxylesterase